MGVSTQAVPGNLDCRTVRCAAPRDICQPNQIVRPLNSCCDQCIRPVKAITNTQAVPSKLDCRAVRCAAPRDTCQPNQIVKPMNSCCNQCIPAEKAMTNLRVIEGSVFDMGDVNNGDQGVIAFANTGKH